MNELISTETRFFISLVVPSDTGSSQLIHYWLKIGTFEPKYWQNSLFLSTHPAILPCYAKRDWKLEFVQGGNFEFIDSLKNNSAKYLLFFEESCGQFWNSKAFVDIATAGTHRGLITIFIRHNLFHQSNLGGDVELLNTHIVHFKSPRDVMQVSTLSALLRLGTELAEWHRDAMSVAFGHSLIDLSPRTDDRLRYWTNMGSIP